MEKKQFRFIYIKTNWKIAIHQILFSLNGILSIWDLEVSTQFKQDDAKDFCEFYRSISIGEIKKYFTTTY